MKNAVRKLIFVGETDTVWRKSNEHLYSHMPGNYLFWISFYWLLFAALSFHLYYAKKRLSFEYSREDLFPVE